MYRIYREIGLSELVIMWYGESVEEAMDRLHEYGRGYMLVKVLQAQ